MSELLAVEGLTLAFQTIPQLPSVITIIPASVTSSYVKGSGDKVYISIAFTVAAYAGGGVTSGTGAGVITGTAVKTNVDTGQIPVREGDSVPITITDTVSPFGTTTDTVYVSVAGQLKAKAE